MAINPILPSKKGHVPMSKYKKRQYALGGAVLAFGVAIAGFAAWRIEATKAKNKEAQAMAAPDINEKSTLTPATDMLDGPAFWQKTAGDQVASQDRRISELEKLLADKNAATGGANLDMNAQLAKSAPAQLPPPPTNMNLGPTLNGASPQVLETPKSIFGTMSQSTPSNSMLTGGSSAGSLNQPKIKENGEVDTVYVKSLKSNIVVTNEGKSLNNSGVNSEGSNSNSTGKFRALKSYIPTGTYLPVVLLGGLDAPINNENAGANPYPVLMQVSDMAQLPNNFRKNFKKCFIVGTGYGELSSERVIIRTEQLSCVDTEGRALDIAIKGWLSGDDGKPGMRGRVVSKQGAVLKNALITGLMSSFGQGLSAAANATTSTALGTVSSVSAGKQMQSAAGAGVGGAFERMAQYYMKLADKLFPVIEVDAGRRGEVVLLKGFQIGDE